MKRAVIVEGLGFGDEGKGATVDFLVRELQADLVIRFCGGSQAGHNVELDDGHRHTFSQFGAGSLAGAATYLGEQMIIHPAAMRAEAAHLRRLTGRDPFAALAGHPRTLVSTLYHQELNRLRELARGAARHGSCGPGIGETRRYWLEHGQDAVTAADLQDLDLLVAKLELLRQRCLLEIESLMPRVPGGQRGRAALFFEPSRNIAANLHRLSAPLTIQPETPPFRTAVLEGSQGVLLDEWRGFHPYTTWSTVTLHHALAIAGEAGIDELCTLGVIRCYLTRHGAGPMPTRDRDLEEAIADRGNPPNPWQGRIRCGWPDLVLLRYAVAAAGGPIDGLVINGLDQLRGFPLRIATGYRRATGAPRRHLPVAAAPCLAWQSRLASYLQQAEPVYERISLTDLETRLEREIAPQAIRSVGPSARGRTLRELRFRPLAESRAAYTPLHRSETGPAVAEPKISP